MDQNKKDENLAKAKEAIYRLLKFRLRSEKEIRDKLRAKGFADHIIEHSIEYFKNLELMDDRTFAREWITSRLARPFGKNRILYELKEKGIDPEILREELDCATRQYSESDIATALALRQSLKYKNIDRPKMKQRVYSYLLRRGFSSDTIYQALKTL